MADFEKLKFVIPGYTPATIPLNRLIEYLQQLAVVLGDIENFHLIEIEESSVAPVLHTPVENALKARDRATQVQQGGGTFKQRAAYHKLSNMLRRDSYHTGRPALLQMNQRVVLEIPAAPRENDTVNGISQLTNIEGQLIKIGGAKEDVHLQVQDLEGNTVSGIRAKRDLAKEIAKFLWEPVRLSGIGYWSRNGDGKWSLDRMNVQSYERLNDENIIDAIAHMQNLEIQWPKNSWQKLIDEREAI